MAQVHAAPDGSFFKGLSVTIVVLSTVQFMYLYGTANFMPKKLFKIQF